jgi:hypothetical protein
MLHNLLLDNFLLLFFFAVLRIKPKLGSCCTTEPHPQPCRPLHFLSPTAIDLGLHIGFPGLPGQVAFRECHTMQWCNGLTWWPQPWSEFGSVSTVSCAMWSGNGSCAYPSTFVFGPLPGWLGFEALLGTLRKSPIFNSFGECSGCFTNGTQYFLEHSHTLVSSGLILRTWVSSIRKILRSGNRPYSLGWGTGVFLIIKCITISVALFFLVMARIWALESGRAQCYHFLVIFATFLICEVETAMTPCHCIVAPWLACSSCPSPVAMLALLSHLSDFRGRCPSRSPGFKEPLVMNTWLAIGSSRMSNYIKDGFHIHIW